MAASSNFLGQDLGKNQVFRTFLKADRGGVNYIFFGGGRLFHGAGTSTDQAHVTNPIRYHCLIDASPVAVYEMGRDN